MAFVSYFDQPTYIRTKETIADMYENRLGKGFHPPEWQDAHMERPPLPPEPQKPYFDCKTGQWVKVTETVRTVESVYFI